MDTRRTLVLMRHGKSAYPEGVGDHERPLAPRGRRQAALAGQWVREAGICVDAVVCSTATRTRQTLHHTGPEGVSTHFAETIYGGSASEILAVIRQWIPADASTVLIVGHEPGMPETVLSLDPAATIERFPTSAYAVIDLEHPWSSIAPGTGRLRSLQIPR